MKERRILDKNITANSYGTFKRCSLNNYGKQIMFTMVNGVCYNVPLDYFLQWFSMPHFVYQQNIWVKWNSSKHKSIINKNISIVKCRRVLSNTAIRVYLSNKTAYVVPWDTVLMACEKRYEHFGGLTKDSKRIVKKYHKMLNGH